MGSHLYHRPSCRSVLFRTRCRDCGTQIYLYLGSCRSGRALKENQPPWTPHCWSADLAGAQAEAPEAFEKKDSGSRLITAAEWRKMSPKKRPFSARFNGKRPSRARTRRNIPNGWALDRTTRFRNGNMNSEGGDIGSHTQRRNHRHGHARPR
jgi:hypothetical protein